MSLQTEMLTIKHQILVTQIDICEVDFHWLNLLDAIC